MSLRIELYWPHPEALTDQALFSLRQKCQTFLPEAITIIRGKNEEIQAQAKKDNKFALRLADGAVPRGCWRLIEQAIKSHLAVK